MPKDEIKNFHKADAESLANGLKNLVEFFEINKIPPPMAISIASNFIVNMFLNQKGDVFYRYLDYFKKLYEMNLEGKIDG